MSQEKVPLAMLMLPDWPSLPVFWDSENRGGNTWNQLYPNAKQFCLEWRLSEVKWQSSCASSHHKKQTEGRTACLKSTWIEVLFRSVYFISLDLTMSKMSFFFFFIMSRCNVPSHCFKVFLCSIILKIGMPFCLKPPVLVLSNTYCYWNTLSFQKVCCLR